MLVHKKAVGEYMLRFGLKIKGEILRTTIPRKRKIFTAQPREQSVEATGRSTTTIKPCISSRHRDATNLAGYRLDLDARFRRSRSHFIASVAEPQTCPVVKKKKSIPCGPCRLARLKTG